jgi:hypothetical protein
MWSIALLLLQPVLLHHSCFLHQVIVIDISEITKQAKWDSSSTGTEEVVLK